MNIKDSKRQFEKLSSFYQQISADGELNNIELDLLKSYTVSFYETLVANTQTAAPVAPVKEIAKVQAPVAPIVATSPPKAPEPIKQAIAEPVAEPIAEQAPTEAIVESSNEPANAQSKDLEQLFSLEKGTELSHTLSDTSISDIKKAMSINERIFTIKELFGGNHEQFDKTISSLNELMTYDDAKKYLSTNVVVDNNWLNPDKSKKVKNFLKLISRKYV